MRSAERIAFLLSFILLGYLLLVFLEARIYERRAEIQIAPHLSIASAKASANTPEPTPSFAAPPSDGEIVGLLHIRRLQVSVPILEGTSARILRLGAGHIPGTAIPGSMGNVSIVGHRDTFFRPLRGIEDGDEIEINTASSLFVYKVEWAAIVSPQDTTVLDPTENPTLTLVTCYPFYFVGGAPERFVVRAHRVVGGGTDAGRSD